MDFNDMKDALLSTLGQAVDGAKDLAGRVADGTKNVAETVADKARSGGNIVKLSVNAATAREDLKKVYQEIGKRCYDLHKDTPEPDFAQLFSEVERLEAAIADREADIAAHKENLKEGFPEITVEFTREEDAEDFADVVDQAEAEAGAAAAEAEAAVEDIVAEAEAAAEQAVADAEQAVADAEQAVADEENP